MFRTQSEDWTTYGLTYTLDDIVAISLLRREEATKIVNENKIHHQSNQSFIIISCKECYCCFACLRSPKKNPRRYISSDFDLLPEVSLRKRCWDSLIGGVIFLVVCWNCVSGVDVIVKGCRGVTADGWLTVVAVALTG